MIKKNNKKFILLFWIILNIFLVFVIFFVFFEVEKLTKNYINDKSEFLLLQQKIKSFNEREEIFEKEKANAYFIKNAFLTPGKDEGKMIAEFIKEMEDIAAKHKTSIEIEDVIQPAQNSPFYVFKASISGEFPDVLKLLFAIENNSFGEYKLMNLEKLNIKRVASSVCNEGEECKSKGIGIEGSFELKVYSTPATNNNPNQNQNQSSNTSQSENQQNQTNQIEN